MLKEDASKCKPGTPHAFNRGVLLGSVHYGRPVTDLFSGKEVPEVVRHELATLVSSNNVRCELVGKANVKAKVGK